MKLIIKKYGQQVLEKDLKEGSDYLMGRGENCDIVLDADPGISREHFKLYSPKESCWTIECVSSKGEGLYAEGESVQGVEIEDSASLSFKNYIFEFVPPQPESETAPPDPVDPSPSSDSSEKEEPDGKTKILSSDSLLSFLCISLEGNRPEYISLNQGNSWIAGRKEECDICIEHPNLSGEHFKIEKIGNRFYIEDLKSSNGTFVNGARLEPDKPVILKSEDKIEISNLTITFETQNKKFNDMIKNLSNLPEKTIVKGNRPQDMILPKVILEDTPEEPEKTSSPSIKKFFNRKRIVLFGLTGAILIALGLFQLTRPEKTAEKTAEETEMEAKERAIQDLYQIAFRLYQQQKYQFCVENLTKLHEMTAYYKDSKELANQCQNALSARKRLEEQELLKKQAEETERKILEITAHCQKEIDIFESVEELNVCLAEGIQLNPQHSEINALQRQIQERESLKALKKQEKEAAQKRISGKRSFYHKAKKLHDQAQAPELLLKAAGAYDKFVKISSGEPALSALHRSAKQAAQTIRDNYSSALNELYSNCESLINQKKMKSAYPVCAKILDFKEDDTKARAWMNQAKEHLKIKLKPIYEESVLQESLSNISAGQELWRQIVAEDIDGGHYHEKAQAKLNQYK